MCKENWLRFVDFISFENILESSLVHCDIGVGGTILKREN